MNETLLVAEGFGHECKVLSASIGLQYARYNQVSKGDMKKAKITLSYCRPTAQRTSLT